ncbi:hypothetical protein CYR55_09565 [Chimaeribacter californicus]|uniref:Uncharacterized protein n=1 Tax=Chimaeribacter californicus TaxID=2060067 RepID=A0A2N5E8H2_9GAMM|nr:hypothetical protein CYR55_09565 [Chimaeribacter californicus]
MMSFLSVISEFISCERAFPFDEISIGGGRAKEKRVVLRNSFKKIGECFAYVSMGIEGMLINDLSNLQY